MRAATHDEICDHNHDLRKNCEPVPPSAPAITNALEIAILVKNLKNIDAAAALIDQYAATVAAGARLEGVEQAFARMDAAFVRAVTP